MDVKALLDIGAEVCVLSKKVADILGLLIRKLEDIRSIVGIGGHSIMLEGVCARVPISIGDIKYE